MSMDYLGSVINVLMHKKNTFCRKIDYTRHTFVISLSHGSHSQLLLHITEVVTRRSSIKKLFLKISHN